MQPIIYNLTIIFALSLLHLTAIFAAPHHRYTTIFAEPILASFQGSPVGTAEGGGGKGEPGIGQIINARQFPKRIAP